MIDIAGRSEDAVGQPIVAEVCQTFSVGFSSGDLGGNASRLMLAGVPTSLVEQNHGVRAG